MFVQSSSRTFQEMFHIHIPFLLVHLDTREESWKLIEVEINSSLLIFVVFFIRDFSFYQIHDHP